MLPVIDREGRLTGRQAVLHSVALLVVSLAPVAAGLGGTALPGGSPGARARRSRSPRCGSRARGTLVAARSLFLASVLYLPALTSLLLLAKL